MYDLNIEKIPVSWSTTSAHKDQEEEATVNGVHEVNGTTNGVSHELPESFLEDKTVRTVYGPVPLKQALDWPVFASYDEMAGCAAYMGGRIPTFEEAKSIYAYVNTQKKKQAENKLGKTVPAVNA